jgi:hypothetical protein
MANQTLTVWQQITVEFNDHSLTGSYAMENGIVDNHTHWSTLRCARNKTSRQVIAIPEAVAGDRETHRLLCLELDRTYCMA